MEHRPLTPRLMGTLCIIGGLVSGPIQNAIKPIPSPPRTARDRGTALGRVLVQGVAVVGGIGLILLDRRRRGRGGRVGRERS